MCVCVYTYRGAERAARRGGVDGGRAPPRGLHPLLVLPGEPPRPLAAVVQVARVPRPRCAVPAGALHSAKGGEMETGCSD